MNLRDLFSGLFWLGISVFICIESVQNNIGTFHYPGPGFFPFCAGTVMGTLAIILIVKALSKKEESGLIRDLWKGMKWHKVILCVICLIIYSILLPTLGYLIATFGLMMFLFGIIVRPNLWIQLVSALVTVLVTYLVFYHWLDVQLPTGLLGF